MNGEPVVIYRKTVPKDIEILPHVHDALEYYQDEYKNIEGARKISMVKSFKYYGYLARWYRGTSIAVLAKEAELEYTTMTNMLQTTQNRVQMYLKLKAQGAL